MTFPCRSAVAGVIHATEPEATRGRIGASVPGAPSPPHICGRLDHPAVTSYLCRGTAMKGDEIPSFLMVLFGQQERFKGQQTCQVLPLQVLHFCMPPTWQCFYCRVAQPYSALIPIIHECRSRDRDARRRSRSR